MALRGKDLITLTALKMPDYLRLLLAYLALEEQLKHPEAQSWYFRQGRAAHEKRRRKLAEQFEAIRQEFNEASLDDLIAARNEKLSHKQRILAKPGIGLVLQIALQSTKTRIDYLEGLIALKSRVTVLEPIAYYLEHPEDFLKLSDW